MYARLVATLDPCAPDIAPDLMQQLKGEFRFRVRSSFDISKFIPLQWYSLSIRFYSYQKWYIRYTKFFAIR